VELPGSIGEDLRVGCPLVTEVVRVIPTVRGPSAAQRALVVTSVLHHGTSGVRPVPSDYRSRGQAAGGGAAVIESSSCARWVRHLPEASDMATLNRS
jgi:hypothetical protein